MPDGARVRSRNKLYDHRGRPVTFLLTGGQSTVRLAAAQDIPPMLEMTRIDQLDFRTERWKRRGRVIEASTIDDGEILLQDVGGERRPIGAGERLDIGIDEGILRSVVFTHGVLDVRFAGRVHDLRLGTYLGDANVNVFRSGMPTVLAWLRAQPWMLPALGAVGAILGWLSVILGVYGDKKRK